MTAAQSEMISLFRDAAKWLEKYAPEKLPPPPLRERVRTFLGRFFPILNRAADMKMQPVVRKASATDLPNNPEPPEKVADAEAAAGSPKSREKLRIPLDLLEAGKPEKRMDGASVREEAQRLADTLQTYKIDAVPTGTPYRGRP